MISLFIINISLLLLVVVFYYRQNKIEYKREKFITDALTALDADVCKLNIDIKNVMREVGVISAELSLLSISIASLNAEINITKI